MELEVAPNLWPTLGLWPSGVCFISDLAPYLAKGSRQYLLFKLRPHCLWKRGQSKQDWRGCCRPNNFLWMFPRKDWGTVVFPKSRRKTDNTKKEYLKGFGFFFHLKAEFRDDLGTRCARNSLTAPEAFCKSLSFLKCCGSEASTACTVSRTLLR